MVQTSNLVLNERLLYFRGGRVDTFVLESARRVYLDVASASDILAVVEVGADDDEAALAAVQALATQVQMLHARYVLPVVQLQLCPCKS